MGQIRRALGRVGDVLASTKGVVFVISLLMAWMTVTTAKNYRLNDLPFRDMLIIMSTCNTVVGVAVLWSGPTTRTRQWVGALTMAYAGLRGLAFAIDVAARTRGVLGVLSTSATGAWAFAWYLGFLVWKRAKSDPYGGSGGEA